MPRPKILEEIAEEEGSYFIKFNFLDQLKAAVVPTSIKWTLTTNDGEVINGRSSVNVAVPTAEWWLALKGEDLQLLEHKSSYSWRIVTVKALYDSSHGDDFPINEAVRFKVRNLRMVAQPLNPEVIEMIFTNDVVTVVMAWIL